jgi:hypothetical protein
LSIAEGERRPGIIICFSCRWMGIRVRGDGNGRVLGDLDNGILDLGEV